MARGFGAAERVGFSKPRAFLGKITSEIQKAMERIAELKNTGRSFDLDAALNALEMAQIKMQNYESRKRGFGAAEAKDWDLVKNFGFTESEAKNQTMFGNYLIGRMEDVMKEVRAPGKMRRPDAFMQAVRTAESATADSIAKGFAGTWDKPRSPGKFNQDDVGPVQLEKEGKFAKGTTVKEVQGNVAALANEIFKTVASGDMGEKSQKAIELASAKQFKEWVDKGVSRRFAARFLSMAQADASVKLEEANERSRQIILEEAGFGRGRK